VFSFFRDTITVDAKSGIPRHALALSWEVKDGFARRLAETLVEYTLVGTFSGQFYPDTQPPKPRGMRLDEVLSREVISPNEIGYLVADHREQIFNHMYSKVKFGEPIVQFSGHQNIYRTLKTGHDLVWIGHPFTASVWVDNKLKELPPFTVQSDPKVWCKSATWIPGHYIQYIRKPQGFGKGSFAK